GAFAGNTWCSFSLSTETNASGLAGGLNPSLGLNHYRSTFSLGICMQQPNDPTPGLRLGFRYALAENASGRLQLFFYSNFIYQRAGMLSRHTIEMEKRTCPENDIDYNSFTLRSMEAYSGFGVKYKWTPHLSSAFSIGGGLYTSQGHDLDRMYRQANGGGLQLRLSVICDIGKHIPKLALYNEEGGGDEL
ncbi:MAG TPA: hypothetical protein VI112_11720, partial [Bacteroidia bacterium]